LKERAKTLVELKTSAAYLVSQRPLTLDDKARALLNDEGKAALKSVVPVLEGANDWTAQPLETAVKAHAEKAGLKLGKIAQPLRAALTGTSTSPGIFDVMEVLGRDESLGRIEDQTN
jgi:glutamyl-tRNA synthetase